MAPTDISEFIRFVNFLADNSGELVHKYYRNLDSIEIKGDASPVTIADREIEAELRNLIASTYPDHGIIGEEFDNEKTDSEYVWVIDPIDGTASFMIGRPIFGTMVGLMQNGEPVLGMIDQPITADRWTGAKGKGCLHNSMLVSTSKTKLENAILCTTGPQYLPNEKLDKFNLIADKVAHTIYGGDCYNYGLLASGKVDVVIEAGLKLHDFIPLVPILKEAGAVITNWQGEELSFHTEADIVVSSNAELHRNIINTINFNAS